MTQEEWNVCIEMVHSTQHYHLDCKLPDMNTGMMFVHILLFLTGQEQWIVCTENTAQLMFQLSSSYQFPIHLVDDIVLAQPPQSCS